MAAKLYSTIRIYKKRLEAWIVKVEIVDGKDTDLHIDKPVYAIHLADVREEKQKRKS